MCGSSEEKYMMMIALLTTLSFAVELVTTTVIHYLAQSMHPHFCLFAYLCVYTRRKLKSGMLAS